jgi:hypothetical protein
MHAKLRARQPRRARGHRAGPSVRPNVARCFATSCACQRARRREPSSPSAGARADTRSKRASAARRRTSHVSTRFHTAHCLHRIPTSYTPMRISHTSLKKKKKNVSSILSTHHPPLPSLGRDYPSTYELAPDHASATRFATSPRFAPARPWHKTLHSHSGLRVLALSSYSCVRAFIPPGRHQRYNAPRAFFTEARACVPAVQRLSALTAVFEPTSRAQQKGGASFRLASSSTTTPRQTSPAPTAATRASAFTRSHQVPFVTAL